ncbi:hypothetical protein ABZY68_08015 [Streptomyces sp. NPDC006482]|uniref:hypothetical protein n=1 Tax=Streptomyces sp. NPDC006482 TaxID=3154306 RepID=UPI0033A18347
MRKILVALGIVLALQSLFALCLVSSLQLLVLRDAPFGVTGASPVVNAVTSKLSLQTLSYANESAVLDAIDDSELYGAYLPGPQSDILIVVPAKSFFGRVELKPRSATRPRSSATPRPAARTGSPTSRRSGATSDRTCHRATPTSCSATRSTSTATEPRRPSSSCCSTWSFRRSPWSCSTASAHRRAP